MQIINFTRTFHDKQRVVRETVFIFAGFRIESSSKLLREYETVLNLLIYV